MKLLQKHIDVGTIFDDEAVHYQKKQNPISQCIFRNLATVRETFTWECSRHLGRHLQNAHMTSMCALLGWISIIVSAVDYQKPS
jgi:hypothetical protein